MKFFVTNLGCKVNAYEAESIASILEKDGFSRGENVKDADVHVIFSCAVTNTAAQKTRQMIHRSKRLNPDCITVVAGCYVQIDPDRLKDAEILVGTKNKKMIPSYIHSYLENHVPICEVSSMEEETFDNLSLDRFETQTRAYLKIQDGCNQFCSYCVIPYARGRERSMKPEIVKAELKRLYQHHKEVVLTGIHTGRYGKEYNTSLSQLLEEVKEVIPMDGRIRLSSIEITEIDDTLIHLMKSDHRFARHLHIPLQSGSDSILKQMRRPYDCEFYYDKITVIRKELENVSISTDLIVGFPGETDSEFEETVAFLKKCEFSFLHVFPYSMRDGTPAASMKNQVDSKIKKERVKTCLALSDDLYASYKDQFIGKSVDVLIERYRDGYSMGYSSEYLPVKVSDKLQQGEMVSLVVKERKEQDLFAERVSR